MNITVKSLWFGSLRRIYRDYPISSKPYISGDTYRKLCEIDLTNLSYEKIFSLSRSKDCKIFLPINRADSFCEWLGTRDLAFFGEMKLILHNGDSELKYATAVSLKQAFKEIFSVNWLGKLSGVYAIPIGLENANIFRNGFSKDYLKDSRKNQTDWVNRPFEIYISFNELTNLKYRSNIKSHFKFSKHILAPEKFEEPNDYRKSLLSSKFVVSPPGNGPDCHRTWESVYLGAVPIVLNKFWNFDPDLPVVTVTKWSDSESAIKNFDLRRLQQSANIIQRLEQLFLENLHL